MGGKGSKRSKGSKVGEFELDSSDSRQGPVAGSCEYANETSGSIKGDIFFLLTISISRKLCAKQLVDQLAR
jgi:hypothetical protein